MIKTIELLNKLQGLHNINSIASILKVSKNKAIYYIYRLRKKGFVKTKKDRENKRIYSISMENKLGGKSYIEIINENSPIKIASSEDYKIYGSPPTLEEALAYAIKSRNLRIMMASLALFKKIKNWKELYSLSKENKIGRKIGALYDLSRKIMKIRKMPKRFRKNILTAGKYEYIIDKLKSSDFKDIENYWKIYIPFNIADLEEYR